MATATARSDRSVLYLMPPPLSSIGGMKIVASDFNGDGKPDLALGWAGATAGLAVLRNTTGDHSAAHAFRRRTLVSPANGAHRRSASDARLE